MPNCRLAVTLIGLTLAVASLSPLAQTAANRAASASSPDAERASQMVEQIEAELATLEVLSEQSPEDGTEEARILLEQQRSEEEIRIGKLIQDAAQMVMTSNDDPAMEPVRQKLRQWLTDMPNAVGEMIERRQGLLENARHAHEVADADQVIEAEQKLNEARESLIEALQHYARLVPLMGEFGVDATAARAEVVELLQRRATAVASRINVARADLEQMSRLIAAAPDSADGKMKAVALQSRIDTGVLDLRLLVNELQRFDVDTSEYQRLLVSVTGNVTDVGFNTTVISALFSDWMDGLGDWVASDGPRLIGKVIVFVIIIALSLLLARLARRLVRQAFQLRHGRSSRLLQRTVADLSGQMVLLFGLLVALSQIGVSVGPMLAGLGIAGFVVAFALQDTLSNFASGAFILFYRPFDVGDVVEAGGVTGKVMDMTLVSTTIATFDNQTLIVPNKKIWGDVIRNVTAQTTRRVDLVFGIGYDDDIEQAERVLADILDADERILRDPAPMIRLHELADSSVNFVVRPWVHRDDYWEVYWHITRTVKIRFDAEGIGIPFPQREVHLHTHGPRPVGDSDQADAPDSAAG